MRKIDPDECQFCGACQSACPSEAIIHAAGTNYYEINDNCIDCGACEAECGFNAIINDNTGD
ncbi:4Fe-4S binding protein [Maridesulfovibrio sp.]|uniref:ATP-binding protein n=1 Tax=Maridesulfovibrio sp. TaxID=2795000 RepID=UPI0029CAAA20|nr:4Fe-4S binding protein [Maridesulfovibrio sp.]